MSDTNYTEEFECEEYNDCYNCPKLNECPLPKRFVGGIVV